MSYFRQSQQSLSSDPTASKKKLLRLIRERKWKHAEKLLTSSSHHHFFLHSFSRCSMQHSIINLALKFEPQLNIVKKLTMLCPNVAYEADCIGQLPLHHALQNGASIEVIEHLLALNKGATDVRNIFGQTPLHLLFYDNAFVPKSCYGQKEQKYVLKIINKFYAIMPSAMLVDDMEERNILECVIEKEFDYRSV